MTISPDTVVMSVLAILTLVQTLMLFVLNSLRTSDKDQATAITKVTAEVAAVNLLMSKSYLTRSEFSEQTRLQTDTVLRAMDRRDVVLDKVFERIDREMDKKVNK